jgi:hypothetical protein
MHVIWINECYINKITGKDNSVIHVIRINECSINKITGKDNSKTCSKNKWVFYQQNNRKR